MAGATNDNTADHSGGDTASVITAAYPLTNNSNPSPGSRNCFSRTLLAFSRLVKLTGRSRTQCRCCELRTACGPIDLVYVNAKGYLTLVETKLWAQTLEAAAGSRGTGD